MTIYYFITADSYKYEIKSKYLKLMNTFNFYLDEDLDESPSNEEHNIDVQVIAKTLDHILEFCQLYNTKPMRIIDKPLKSNLMKNNVDLEYADFIDSKTYEEIIELIEAANYLYIQPLIELGSAKIASMIKNKTPEEIRKVLQIENDLSAEEEKEIKEKYKWINNIK